MTIKINGKEISKLLTTVDMTQGDRSIRHCINNLLEALADKEEPNTNNLAVGEKAKEETLEEKKARLEEGWEEQENWKYLSTYIQFNEKVSIYFNKQKTIAKLNTVIDKLNKEEGWVENWGGDYQRNFYIEYDYELEKFDIQDKRFLRYPLLINYMSEKTADFLLENYQSELKVVFGIK